MKTFSSRFLVLAVVFTLSLSILATMVSPVRTVRAAPGGVCRVILALDISGSIGEKWSQFSGQVRSIFNPAFGPKNPDGTPRTDVEVAFWTFSNSGDSNFNQYYSSYVNLTQPQGNAARDNFDKVLLNDIPASDELGTGLTNYAHGFGYNPTSSPLTNSGFSLQQNTNSSIRGIANASPNLVVLLTDGEPNAPGQRNAQAPYDPPYNGDGNDGAINAAIESKNRYPGTAFAGGFISDNPNRATTNLEKIIPVDQNSPVRNVGPLVLDSSGGGTLSEFIVGNIEQYCDAQSASYNLIPAVSVINGGVIVGNAEPEFSYTVRNDSENPGSSAWSILDLVLKPGVNWECLGSGGGSGCDNINKCTDIRNRIGTSNIVRCIDSTDEGVNSSNTGAIPPNDTAVNVRDPGLAKFDESWELGTKVCRVLYLANAGGASNRVHGACAVIGKPPLVQVLGGDVRVGKHFDSDTSGAGENAGVYTSRFKLTGTAAPAPNGLTFGSWVEYGVMAPGVIKNTASLSAYRGGYADGVSTTCKLDINRLTFANSETFAKSNKLKGECGEYKGNAGKLLNVVSQFSLDVNPEPAATRTLNVSSASKDRYKYSGTGAVTIEGGMVGSGKHVFVYAPDAKVIIRSDIVYADGPYSDISQIPQVVIVAKDISIRGKGADPSDNGVTRVDAWLIAQGTTSTNPYSIDDGAGVLNTCTDNNGVTPRSGYINAKGRCNNQLIVNGPVIARQLHLWRTTVFTDGACKVDDVNYRSNRANCTKRVDRPAEIFNLPGSTMLWVLSQLTGSGVRSGQVTEAPPIY